MKFEKKRKHENSNMYERIVANEHDVKSIIESVDESKKFNLSRDFQRSYFSNPFEVNKKLTSFNNHLHKDERKLEITKTLQKGKIDLKNIKRNEKPSHIHTRDDYYSNTLYDFEEIKLNKMLSSYDSYLKKTVLDEIEKLHNEGGITENEYGQILQPNFKKRLLDSNSTMLDTMHSKIFGFAQILDRDTLDKYHYNPDRFKEYTELERKTIVNKRFDILHESLYRDEKIRKPDVHDYIIDNLRKSYATVKEFKTKNNLKSKNLGNHTNVSQKFDDIKKIMQEEKMENNLNDNKHDKRPLYMKYKQGTWINDKKLYTKGKSSFVNKKMEEVNRMTQELKEAMNSPKGNNFTNQLEDEDENEDNEQKPVYSKITKAESRKRGKKGKKIKIEKIKNEIPISFTKSFIGNKTHDNFKVNETSRMNEDRSDGDLESENFDEEVMTTQPYTYYDKLKKYEKYMELKEFNTMMNQIHKDTKFINRPTVNRYATQHQPITVKDILRNRKAKIAQSQSGYV